MSFYCQECRTPLRLDGSLNELNPAAFRLLTESTGNPLPHSHAAIEQSRPAYSRERKDEYDRVSRNGQNPTYKRNVGPTRHTPSSKSSVGPSRNAPDMSFVMLTDSQVLPPVGPSTPSKPVSTRRKSQHFPGGPRIEDDSLSDQMETATRLFEILSSRSDIDHPICVECTERLVDQLQKRLSNSSRERDAYVEFLRQASSDVPTGEEVQEARKQLEAIRDQERLAFTELERLEKEKADMESEIYDLEAQSHELDLKEEQFWTDRNDFSQKLFALQNDRDRLTSQYDHDSRQLERLRRANVFNDAFSIGHDGYYGTINGLRLGRLSERPVDWSEINAAWGYTILLLAIVAEKLGFVYRGYELIPMGSTSRIRVYRQPRSGSSATSNDTTSTSKASYVTHKLCYSGDALSTLGGLFHTDFDSAMIAFLECLRQTIEFAHRNPHVLPDGSVVECPRINYKIEKDKIGEHSIKLSGLGNQDAEWTKALKLTLICCKFLLAHASNAPEPRHSR